MLAEEDETEEEEELWSEEAGGSESEAPTEAEEDEDDEQGGEASDLGASSWPKALPPGPPGEGPRAAAWEGAWPSGLEAGGLGVTCEGPSSTRKEGSGVLQLLSTVCESGEDSRASREGAVEEGGSGGVCSGGVEVEGGTTPVEEDDDDEEELGTGPAGAG